MKVVIDISADNFNAIRQGRLYFIGHDRLDQCITEAFQSCTIIPKGHGDLIDREVAKEVMMYEMCGTGYQGTAMRVLDSDFYTPTVIEADKENDNER